MITKYFSRYSLVIWRIDLPYFSSPHELNPIWTGNILIIVTDWLILVTFQLNWATDRNIYFRVWQCRVGLEVGRLILTHFSWQIWHYTCLLLDGETPERRNILVNVLMMTSIMYNCLVLCHFKIVVSCNKTIWKLFLDNVVFGNWSSPFIS